MSKIYSRKRFIIKRKKKIIKITLTLVIAVIIYKITIGYVGPVFETLCEEKVRIISTIISNQESTKIMNKYQYEELYTIEKDEVGDVTIIKSNVVPINNMISDLTEAIQNRFNEVENTEIKITLGNLLGGYYFSGIGPSIPIKVRSSGTIDTEIKSEFIAQGINQTLHRVYVNFECYFKVITPVKNFEKKVTNQVIIAEHVIVGNIPDAYYNLEGVNSTGDMLNSIK